MKKIILVLLLICSLSLCLVACNKKTSESVYEQLNKLVEQSYNELQLTVTVGEGEDKLVSTYTVTKNEVIYSVEYFEEIMLGEELPENRIGVLTGTATVTKGKITAINGDAVELPSSTELNGKNFNFIKDDFIDAKVSLGTFTATVKTPTTWLGTDKEITDLTVEVNYSDTCINTILLNYKLSGTTVQTEYKYV